MTTTFRHSAFIPGGKVPDGADDWGKDVYGNHTFHLAENVSLKVADGSGGIWVEADSQNNDGEAYDLCEEWRKKLTPKENRNDS